MLYPRVVAARNESRIGLARVRFPGGKPVGVELAECRRVVRPGGLPAVKEVDMALWRLDGIDAEREPRHWLERTGLETVWSHTLIECWQPLRPVERQHPPVTAFVGIAADRAHRALAPGLTFRGVTTMEGGRYGRR